MNLFLQQKTTDDDDDGDDDASFRKIKGYVKRVIIINQGSHASWKVRDFFLENSRTWKVIENHFGPGKSWINILESHAFFYNHCMSISRP